MRPRQLAVALGLAAGFNTLLFVSACKEEPAATVREVNKLDETSADAPNPQEARFKEFFDRVRDYMKTHQAAEAKVPSLRTTDDPKEVSGREKALADEIRVARAGAQQGEVFSPSAAKEIADIVAEDFNGRVPKEQQALLAEVPMKTPPSINTDYPTALPLATVPAGLLQKLPTLPEELEYRFLGRHLILRDTKANLIVDFVPDVVPAAPAKTSTAGREAHP